MSNIIDLGLSPDIGGDEYEEKETNETLRIIKLKRLMGVLLLELEEKFKTYRFLMEKTEHYCKITVEWPQFYYTMSFVTKIEVNFSRFTLLIENILTNEGRPHIMSTKNQSISCLQLFMELRSDFPDFEFAVDLQNGCTMTKRCISLNDSIISVDDYFHSAITKSLLTLYEKTEKVIKMASNMSQDPFFQTTTNPTTLAENWKTFEKALKYMKISNIEIEGSETMIERKKATTNESSAEKESEIMKEIFGPVLSSVCLFENSENNQAAKCELTISEQEVRELHPHLRFPKARILNELENEFIFNEIFVENSQKIALAHSGMKGGNSELFISKIAFEYIYSAKNFENKKISIPKLEKIFLIKAANNKKSEQYLDHEIKILSTLKSASSAYLIKYYKTEQNSPLKNKLLMDYIQNCFDLDKYEEKNKMSLSIITKLLIMSNLANGIRFIKKQKIVHMDLTPKNILVGPNFLTKLIDFGEAYCERICGPGYCPGYTNPYGPPEVFTERHFDSRSDIYSFGMIVSKFFFGFLPFNPTEKLKKSFYNKKYYRKLFFAPEYSEYIWHMAPMMIIINLACRSIHPDLNIRPDPTWIRVILRMLMSWYTNLASTK